MKFAIFSAWESAKRSNIEVIWDILGKDVSLIFGRDCASAAIWMFSCLLLKWITVLLRVDSVIPLGVLFAFPYFIQCLSRRLPFMEDNLPLLPIRIAEIILGRFSPTTFAVVIPAHLLGCILGTVLFASIFPLATDNILNIISYDTSNIIFTFLFEALLSSIYVTAYIALPEILAVNKFSPYLLSVPLLPILCIPLSNHGASFHPAALYALAYTRGLETFNFASGQAVHLLAPIAGAILAGFICCKFFPDDPSTWRRK